MNASGVRAKARSRFSSPRFALRIVGPGSLASTPRAFGAPPHSGGFPPERLPPSPLLYARDA
ncbi:exported hypothetical protein [Xanthomonas phaseoli pv. phaseoli]|nr:exported hypothetical protein [Xanthomonas phaseoli pv. phaseoli]